MVVKTKRREEPAPSATTAIKRVVATFEMDTVTFVKHFSARHGASLPPGQTMLSEKIDYHNEQLYRAWHRKLHEADEKSRNPRLKHFHDPDPPEAAIDRAIECIIENRDWGWKEIAGFTAVFAAFPDGKIATRIGRKVEYHDSIEEASDRIATTPIPEGKGT